VDIVIDVNYKHSIKKLSGMDRFKFGIKSKREL
jgi:hypothetical protein